MTTDESYQLPKLLVLEHQPDFPDQDLSASNRDILPAFLYDEPGIVGQSKHLESYQHTLYTLAVFATQQTAEPLDNREKQYRAFTHGFASFDIINILVGNAFKSSKRAVEQFRAYFLDQSFTSEHALAERSDDWPLVWPNIHATVQEIGRLRGETPQLLRARQIGAQIAHELLRTRQVRATSSISNTRSEFGGMFEEGDRPPYA